MAAGTMKSNSLDAGFCVIIPTLFRNPRHFDEAIQSIERQTFRNFEVCVIVDGPTSCSGELEAIMSQLSCKYRVIYSKKQRGVARCLNILARLSDSRYLVRMDDDDICLDDRFGVQFPLMETDQYDVLGSNVTLIDADGVSLGRDLKSKSFDRPVSYFELLFGDIFFHPTVVIKRDWWKKNKYNPSWKYGEDRELWIRSYHSSSFFNVDSVLLKYRLKSRGHPVFLKAMRNKRLLLRTYRSRFGAQYLLIEMYIALQHLRALALRIWFRPG